MAVFSELTKAGSLFKNAHTLIDGYVQERTEDDPEEMTPINDALEQLFEGLSHLLKAVNELAERQGR